MMRDTIGNGVKEGVNNDTLVTISLFAPNGM